MLNYSVAELRIYYFVENYFLPIAFLNTEIPKNKKWAAYHTHCWNRQTP